MTTPHIHTENTAEQNSDALDQIIARAEPCLLRFGPGIFKFARPVHTRLQSRLMLVGSGSNYAMDFAGATTELQYTGRGSEPFITLDGNHTRGWTIGNLGISYTHCTGPLIRCTGSNDRGGAVGLYLDNVALYGNTATGVMTAESLIELQFMERFSARHCYFTNAVAGIYLPSNKGNQTCGGLWVSECHFGDFRDSAFVSGTTGGGAGWAIRDSYVNPVRLAPQHYMRVNARQLLLSNVVCQATDGPRMPTGAGTVIGGGSCISFEDSLIRTQGTPAFYVRTSRWGRLSIDRSEIVCTTPPIDAGGNSEVVCRGTRFVLAADVDIMAREGLLRCHDCKLGPFTFGRYTGDWH